MGEKEKLPAAQAVVKHLNLYGANGRVLILAPTVNTLAEICLYGRDTGLLHLYGNEFSPVGDVLTQGQMNHTGGGQVLVMEALWAEKGRLRGHIFTQIWAENMQDSGDLTLRALESARGQLRTNEILLSLDGFYEK